MALTILPGLVALVTAGIMPAPAAGAEGRPDAPAGVENVMETREFLKQRTFENGVHFSRWPRMAEWFPEAPARWEQRLPASAGSVWYFAEIAETTFFAENPECPTVDGAQIVYASKDHSKRFEINRDTGEIRYVFDTEKEWRGGCNLSLPQGDVQPRFCAGAKWNWPHLLLQQWIQDPAAPDGKLRLGRYDKLELSFSAELLSSAKGQPEQCPEGTWDGITVGNHCLFYAVFTVVRDQTDTGPAGGNRMAQRIYCLYPVFCSYDGKTHHCETPWLGDDPAAHGCYWTPIHTGLEIGRPAQITIDADALIKESVAAVNQRFGAGLSPADYFIEDILIGWEKWGAFRTDIRVRDLSFTGRKFEAQPYADLCQYYNPDKRDHLYTTELQPRPPDGYHREKAIARIPTVPRPQTNALFEYFNKKTGDHYYTTDCLPFGFLDYEFQGRIGFVFETPPGPSYVELHQYWSVDHADHYYSTDPKPADFASYTYEKSLGYVQPPEQP